MVGSLLARKYYKSVAVNSSDEHSSLLQLSNNYNRKKCGSTDCWI